MLASSRRTRPGFDLCFSAPKSVSLLFVFGDSEIRRAVVGARVRRSDGTGLPGTRGVLGAAWPCRHAAPPCRRVRGGGIPASHEPGRRPAAAHPRCRRQHGDAAATASGARCTPMRSTTVRRPPAISTRRICVTRSAGHSACAGDLSCRARGDGRHPRPGPQGVQRATRRIKQKMTEQGITGRHGAEIAALATRLPKDTETDMTRCCAWKAQAISWALTRRRSVRSLVTAVRLGLVVSTTVNSWTP